MECAGNGRRRLEPRPVSQPWLDEAVGTAGGRGTPLRALLPRPGLEPTRSRSCSPAPTTAWRAAIEQDYQRSLSLDDAARAEVLLAYEMNGAPLAPQHGFPLRLRRARLVRDDERQVARPRIEAVDRPFDGLPAARRLPVPQPTRTTGEPCHRMRRGR